jgi:hypothetical protein
VDLKKSEVIHIFNAVDNHPNNVYKRVWTTDQTTIALFLNEIETGKHTNRYHVITVILEFDSSIEPSSEDRDYLFEHETDAPAGKLTVILLGGAPPIDFNIALRRQNEVDFLAKLGVIPLAFQAEVKCPWCKKKNRFAGKDFGEDGRAYCVHCDVRIKAFY